MLASLVIAATAFNGPSALRTTRATTSTVQMSRFEGKIWDIDAKMEILNEWDPEEKRGYNNFNPFERDDQGNCCDPNGKFPGEGAYGDPKRPDTNFATMTKDRESMKAINADPRMLIKGKAGNWKFKWDEGLGMIPADQQ